MNVVHYEPVNMIRQFRNEVNRLIQDDLSTSRQAGRAAPARPNVAAWAPAVDIREDVEGYLITADVPGVEPDTIEVTMEAGVLSIKGTRGNALAGAVPPAAEGAEPGADAVAGAAQSRFSRRERSVGDFERRFSLPDEVDADGIEARCRHGVLSVSIPKKAAPQPRRIEIQ